MRLSVVDNGHAPEQAAVLATIRERSGHEPLGVVKTLMYRPELFDVVVGDRERARPDLGEVRHELFPGRRGVRDTRPEIGDRVGHGPPV